MIKMDPSVLIHQFDYYEYMGEDSFHAPSWGDKQTVQKCRIDWSTDYSRDGREKSVQPKAVIFCYKGNTTPWVDFTVQSRIVINQQEYTVHRVIPIPQPFSPDLFSVEVEVV